MTPLAARIAGLIRETGPMTIADYMQTCLTDSEYGYYATRDPFGASGDFVTAPEVSQMFGELIGLAIAQSWMDQGAPGHFNLVELGPGRGTLMADLLRATARVPGFHDAASIQLVETSPTLRALQTQNIRMELTHHDALDSVPAAPTFLVANEFFDALPIRQFIRDGDGWRERVVGLANDQLAFGLTDKTQRPELSHRLDDTRDGDLVEACLQAQNIAAEIGKRLDASGGVALLFDYGDWRSLGDTFQGLKEHTSLSPLEAPGLSDLTAHVDFEAIATAASPAQHARLTPQGVFLERLGIVERARALAGNLSGDALDQHVAAHRRLTHPDEMGTLFKVMALYPQDAPIPPGVMA